MRVGVAPSGWGLVDLCHDGRARGSGGRCCVCGGRGLRARPAAAMLDLRGSDGWGAAGVA